MSTVGLWVDVTLGVYIFIFLNLFTLYMFYTQIHLAWEKLILTIYTNTG